MKTCARCGQPLRTSLDEFGPDLLKPLCFNCHHWSQEAEAISHEMQALQFEIEDFEFELTEACFFDILGYEDDADLTEKNFELIRLQQEYDKLYWERQALIKRMESER